MLDVAIDKRGNVYGATLREGVVRIAAKATFGRRDWLPNERAD